MLKIYKLLIRASLVMLILPICVTIVMSHPAAGSAETDGLTLEPLVSEAKYCREPEGGTTLRLKMVLHYQNNSLGPIVLPMFTVLSGYELFSDEEALKLDRKESSVSLRSKKVLDAMKIDSAGPDQRLFWILRPGESASSYASVSIVVQPAHGSRGQLLGKDRYVRLRMNPWPADQRTGEKLRNIWQREGVLWMREVLSLPLKVHVDYQPRADSCPGKVD
jgi:hypothetical protein